MFPLCQQLNCNISALSVDCPEVTKVLSKMSTWQGPRCLQRAMLIDPAPVGSMSWSSAQQISHTQHARSKTSFFQTNTFFPLQSSSSASHSFRHIVPKVLFIIGEGTKWEKETFRCATYGAKRFSHFKNIYIFKPLCFTRSNSCWESCR